ncbi:MAG: betaine/proline/choline family ABC transporter ATP-binding protein [Rhodospirillales bacterium]|nr:betaine/proline/choline family ABC transporter ATP-binding protein [Rhodospirillales bacterium]MBT4039395.1 betaine/proline/choline family ABC transporter ATP-binding protein [Rhodospirillales bacterium]MBT4626372.1 betaine/proline/choline family ABC transporter ATP-binding protein [Rhodospirillales bacterium]MBT5351375.1 betaine/proline/choline family ABC transporter ATP-binding protein [Rhodospirillales bacterium]MBT5519144.1 betaine/proline/choline family ABC transporter ATP-binding prote
MIDTDSTDSGLADRKIKLACHKVWKVFGENADQFLSQHDGVPSSEALNEAGLIAAVRDATVEVGEGEIFVIMGLSGSGKSTLVRCFSRLIESTAGNVVFDGQVLQDMSDSELNDIRRHKMGMVFQHFALLPHLTVVGNVAFPLEIQGVDKHTRDQRALEMIELVGLQGRENYYPRELSGGQQQRVGIARSLAVEPDIWFLDEPFSALDPLIRREMQDEFLRLQNVLHKTIVFITHDFDEAIRLADRIAIMKDGEIVQTGTPEELVLNPATDYVEEFTKGISRSKVLSVKSIMTTSTSEAASTPVTVPEHAKVDDIAATVMDSGGSVAVVNASNRPVGLLTREAVVDVLVTRDQ